MAEKKTRAQTAMEELRKKYGVTPSKRDEDEKEEQAAKPAPSKSETSSSTPTTKNRTQTVMDGLRKKYPTANKVESSTSANYTLSDIRNGLNDTYSALEGSEKNVTNFLDKYGATADDIHEKLASKYGATQDDTGTWLFGDQASYDAYMKEADALGALYDQYNADVGSYNEWYTRANQYKEDAFSDRDLKGLHEQLAAAKREEAAAQSAYMTAATNFDAGVGDIEEVKALGAKANAATKARDQIEQRVDQIEFIQKYKEKTYEDTFGGQFKANLALGRIGQETAFAYDDYWKDDAEQNRAYAEALELLNERFQMQNEAALDDENAKATWITKDLAQHLPQRWDQIKAGVKGAAVGGAAGSLVGSAVPGAGTLAGGVKGAKMGATAAVGLQSYEQMRGAAFQTLLNAGIDEDIARACAGDEGVLSALAEMADTAWTIGSSGVGAVTKALGKGGTKAVAKKGIGRLLSEALAKFGLDVPQEMLEEGFQQTVSIANLQRAQRGETGFGNLLKETGSVAKDAITGENTAARDEILDAAWQGGKLALMMNGAGRVLDVAVDTGIRAHIGKKYKDAYGTDAVPALIESGLESAEGTESRKLAEKLDAKQKSGKTVTNAEVGALRDANVQAITEENAATAEPAAEAAESSQETLEDLARETVSREANVSQAKRMAGETAPQQVPFNALSAETPEARAYTAKKRSLEKKLGYGENGLKLFNEIAAENNATVDELIARFDTPYQAGLTGLSPEKASIDGDFQMAAYKAGLQDYNLRREQDAAKKPSLVYSEEESGFDFTGAPSDVKEEYRAFADFLNKKMGVKGVFDGYDGAGYNAKYTKSTGVVSFAQDFGINPELMKKLGSKSYLEKVEKLSSKRGNSFIFYLAHEVADHVATDRAPTAMRAFNHAMYNYLGTDSGKMNLARSKQAFYGDHNVDLTTEGAIEEVSADSIVMLYDGDEKKLMDAVTRVLNGEDKQAKEGAKIYKSKLDEFIQKLKAWFRKLTGKENAEARAQVQQGISELERLRDMFEQALAEAAKNVEMARAEGLENRSEQAYNDNTETQLSAKEYWRPKLTKAEWSLLNYTLSKELHSEKNKIDDETKWAFASEKGVNVFALYGIGDGTDATPLYAVGGKKALSDYEKWKNFLEGYANEPYADRTAFGSWTEGLRSEKGYRSSNIYDAAGRATAVGYDKVHGEEQRGDGRGTVDAGSKNRNEKRAAKAVDVRVEDKDPTHDPDIRYSLKDSDGRDLTPEQAEYFKDSKIRDENGNLRVVYHSTDADFTVFDADEKTVGELYYFAKSKAWSKNYHKEERYHSPKHTMGVYLNITKPFDMRNAPPRATGKEWIEYFESAGVPISEKFRSFWSTPQKNSLSYGKGTIPQWGVIRYDGISGNLRESLSSVGYDGLIIKDKAFGKAENTTYVCFDKNQIKRTNNKKPTSDPDIRYSLKDSEGRELSKEQQEFFKDSKARDENGNLVVLYHGTERGGFTVFSESDDIGYFFTSKASVAATYSGTHSPVVYEGSIKTWEDAIEAVQGFGYGVYLKRQPDGNYLLHDGTFGDETFAPDELDAFTEMFIQDYVSDKQAGNYKVYLNLKDPLIVDGKGASWSEISGADYQDHIVIIPDEGTVEIRNLETDEVENILDFETREDLLQALTGIYGDGGAAEYILDMADMEIDWDDLENSGRFEEDFFINDGGYVAAPMSTRDWVAEAVEMGCDGVIFRNISDEGKYGRGYGNESDVYVALNSNQIKSVNNLKPTENDDIRYSIKSSAHAAGIDVSRDDSGKVVFKIGGKTVNKVTAQHIREKSGFGALITAAVELGNISDAEAKKQYKAVADIMNLVMNTQDPEMVWAWVGSSLFSAVKSNSDGQYGTTIDFTTVCRKTQEMITAMSRAMVKMKRGLTKDEVTKLQAELIREGSNVPCPVCYVFSRWAGIGSILDNMYRWQEKYDSYTRDQLTKRTDELTEKLGKGKSRELWKMLREQDEEMDSISYEREQLTIEKKQLESKRKTAVRENEAHALQAIVARQEEITKRIAQINKRRNEIKQSVAPELAWLLNVRTQPDYAAKGNVKPEVLFNLDDAATFADSYPLAWKYRTSRGPGAGKAILPYSDMRLGDLILGIDSNSATGNALFENVKGTFTDEQQKAFEKAVQRTKAQNLIGGQRFQSTSDFRYDYALDYVMAFFECQALGSNLQTYTKIVEFADMVASVGGDVNLSVMPKNKGYITTKDGVNRLVFSSVTGIDFEAAKRASELHDSAQLILVGINDEHILAALEDSEETLGKHIGFVIPYHASGASINEFIRVLVSNLGESFTTKYYQDYSDVQGDKEKKNATAAQKRRYELRSKLLKGKDGGKNWEPSADDIAFIRGESVDISGKSFADLRSVELKALRGDKAAIAEYESWTAGALQNLYNRLWANENDPNYGVRLNTKQAAAVMPHEYWNKTVSRERAYINGFLFRSYCYNLGLTPRFSGATVKGETHGDFTGSKGYWKTLIDRPMYNNAGEYRDQQAVNMTGFQKEMLTPAYTEKHWAGYAVKEPDAAKAIRAADRFMENMQHSLKGEHEMQREIARIRSEGAKAGKSQREIESEVMGVVGPEYGELLKTYGEIERGERPYREIKVPKKTSDDRKVSQTIRTVLEAEATPDAAIPTIEELVTQGDFSYDTITDKAAMAAATKTIKRKGYETAMAEWMADVREGKVSKGNTALGWALYNAAANAGDLKAAMSILNGMVQHQRSAAQALQATRILKKMSPEAQLYGIQRSVESLMDELKAKHGDDIPNLEINVDLARDLLNATTDEERDEATKAIYMDIGRQMPSTFIDKWNAWRYLAMLGNPRTHVRNVAGNLGFAPVVLAKDVAATFVESIVGFASRGKMGRTKAMPGLKLLKAAWDDYVNAADEISAGGKYSDSALKNQYVEDGRQIFKFKPLEKARKSNSAAMEFEDMWFARPHYAFALAQYCKANGVTVEQLRTGKALGNGRNYAIREAQKATYRDTNAVSQTISELGRYHGDNKVKKGVSVVMEGILPFRKTPANILVRGVEYSPIGLLKSITYDLYRVSKKEITAAEAIDNIAAGMTGTMLLAAGAYLAAEGLIRGSGGDDEEEKKFDELQGHQAYALELPDGTSVTLDWLAPEALPLFVGVNLYEMARENKGRSSLADILTAVSNVTEPMLEMSCLQSLNDVFDNVGYASSNGMSPLVSALSGAATSYLTQAFPTILGQAERSAQDVRMTTYTEKNGFLTSDMQYTLGKISAKTPGWDFQQIPYVDAWGRTESAGSRGANAANNFLNPAYTSKIETSAMEEELKRLNKVKGDDHTILPSRASKYFNVDGERKDLTAEEYLEYATEKGQRSYDLLTDLTGRPEYRKANDDVKAKAVEMAYEYANALAKTKVSDYKPDGWVATALETEKFSGMDEVEYIMYKMALNMADKPNESGDYGTFTQEEKARAIGSMKSLSDKEIAAVWNTKDGYAAYKAGVDMRALVDKLGSGEKVNVDKLVSAVEAGIGEDNYYDFIDMLNEVDQPTESGTLGTFTQDEAEAAIRAMSGLTKEQKAWLFQSVNKNWKKNPWK